MLTRTTRVANPTQIQKKWYVIDADGLTLGRLATEAAVLLRGKHKPIYTPNIDTGDYVIVVNADKVQLTGAKLDKKFYYRHTGYPGHLKKTSYRDLMKNKPTFVVEKAIKGMLPHNKLGSFQGKKLKVYAGGEHKHAAQNPETYTLKG